MSSFDRPAAGLLAVVALLVASCSAPAPQATSAPPAQPAAKPTAAAAQPTAKPAAQPSAAPAAKPSPAPAASAAPASKPAASPAAKASGAPVKLGFMTPLSGPAAAYGGLLKYAPQLVMEDVNGSGGINGSPLEVVIVDSPNDPNRVLTSIQRLVNSDNVLAVAGPYFTGEADVAAPLADQLKVPNIFNALKTGITAKSEWAFQFNIADDKNVPMALDAFKKVYPKVRKMAIVGDTQTAVTAAVLKDLWPKLLPQAGYEVVDTVTFSFGTTDFSAIATRIKASGAEGLALSALSPAAPTLLKELERQGVKLPVVSSEHLQTVPPFPKIAGSAGEGMIMSFTFSPDRVNKDARVKQWLSRYEAAAAAGASGGEKPIIGYALEPLYYDLLSAVAKVMRDGGVNASTPVAQGREKIRDGMVGLRDFKGIGGDISAGPGHTFSWEVTPLIVKDGEWRTIPQ